MSDLSGIYSLRGFLYQKRVFELLAFRHGWEDDDVLTYEGLDDIDTGKSHLIYSKRNFSQVKSGKLTKNIYYGVLSNWFLLDNDFADATFRLIFEWGTVDDYKSDSFFDSYFKYISSDKIKKEQPNCKHSKALRLFSTKEEMKRAFNCLCERITFLELSQEQIYDSLIEEAHNQSIVNEMMAKAFIFHFIDALNKEIDESVINTTPYELTKQKYFEIYISTINSVKRSKYVFDIKKYSKHSLDELKTMADKQFYDQIISVLTDSDFLMENIIDELEYEIFKESYDDQESLDKIEALESSVHARYRMMKASPNIKSNYDFYLTMTDSSFSSDILEMNYLAKIGCCNYLTSSKALPEYAIKWDVRDE